MPSIWCRRISVSNIASIKAMIVYVVDVDSEWDCSVGDEVIGIEIVGERFLSTTSAVFLFPDRLPSATATRRPPRYIEATEFEYHWIVPWSASSSVPSKFGNFVAWRSSVFWWTTNWDGDPGTRNLSKALSSIKEIQRNLPSFCRLVHIGWDHPRPQRLCHRWIKSSTEFWLLESMSWDFCPSCSILLVLQVGQLGMLFAGSRRKYSNSHKDSHSWVPLMWHDNWNEVRKLRTVTGSVPLNKRLRIRLRYLWSID